MVKDRSNSDDYKKINKYKTALCPLYYYFVPYMYMCIYNVCMDGCVCLHACVHVGVCMYVCARVCICMCVCVHACVCAELSLKIDGVQ